MGAGVGGEVERSRVACAHMRMMQDVCMRAVPRPLKARTLSGEKPVKTHAASTVWPSRLAAAAAAAAAASADWHAQAGVSNTSGRNHHALTGSAQQPKFPARHLVKRAVAFAGASLRHPSLVPIAKFALLCGVRGLLFFFFFLFHFPKYKLGGMLV